MFERLSKWLFALFGFHAKLDVGGETHTHILEPTVQTCCMLIFICACTISELHASVGGAGGAYPLDMRFAVCVEDILMMLSQVVPRYKT